MSLSQKQTEDICMIYGGHKQCRYLITDDQNNKHMCGKLIKKVRESIDDRVDEFLKKAKANGQDPATIGRACGDNCQGYIFLKYKKQGYDQKG
jgi:hypothetical protein